jgi:hypothetical protein
MLARAAHAARRRAVVDLGWSVGAAVLVAGSARSGTTWFAECVARALRARTLFEPFIVDDRGRPASLQRGRWSESTTRRGVSRYLPETPNGDPWEDGVRRVLTGSVPLLWRDQDRPGLYRRRVVKAVRGNLLLGHVAARWPKLPVVWLVRDPIAVVSSQLRMREQGWDFDWQPECVLAQPQLMRDWLAPFQDVMLGTEALVERLAVRWCVENYVPLHQASVARGVLRLGYRELCTGVDAWRRLSGLLVECGSARGGDLDERGVLPRLLDQGVPGPRVSRHGGGDMARSDRHRILRVVERFGLPDLARDAGLDQ